MGTLTISLLVASLLLVATDVLVTPMKLKHLALVTVTAVGILFPSIAQALQWVEVAVADDYSTRVYVDQDSVKRRGSTVQFWSYYVDRQPNGNSGNAFKELDEVNCATDSYRVLRTVTYANGRVQSDKKENTMLAANPGTLVAAALNSVCRR